MFILLQDSCKDQYLNPNENPRCELQSLGLYECTFTFSFKSVIQVIWRLICSGARFICLSAMCPSSFVKTGMYMQILRNVSGLTLQCTWIMSDNFSLTDIPTLYDGFDSNLFCCYVQVYRVQIVRVNWYTVTMYPCIIYFCTGVSFGWFIFLFLFLFCSYEFLLPDLHKMSPILPKRNSLLLAPVVSLSLLIGAWELLCIVHCSCFRKLAVTFIFLCLVHFKSLFVLHVSQQFSCNWN